jgi:hypothetical protein
MASLAFVMFVMQYAVGRSGQNGSNVYAEIFDLQIFLNPVTGSFKAEARSFMSPKGATSLEIKSAHAHTAALRCLIS